MTAPATTAGVPAVRAPHRMARRKRTPVSGLSWKITCPAPRRLTSTKRTAALPVRKPRPNRSHRPWPSLTPREIARARPRPPPGVARDPRPREWPPRPARPRCQAPCRTSPASRGSRLAPSARPASASKRGCDRGQERLGDALSGSARSGCRRRGTSPISPSRSRRRRAPARRRTVSVNSALPSGRAARTMRGEDVVGEELRPRHSACARHQHLGIEQRRRRVDADPGAAERSGDGGAG